MKRISLIIGMLLLRVCSVDAQVAIYDALTIADNYVDVSGTSFSFKPDNASKAALAGILKGYLPDTLKNDPELMAGGVFVQYFKNPFIGEEIISINAASDVARIGSFSKTLTSVGGFDVTTLVNGISDLMIDRAKQELSISFFYRFQKLVDKNEEIRVLFPKTTDNLRNLLSYQYPEMISTLRTGFFEDLNSITLHLDDVLELDRYKELLKDMPEMRIVIRSLRLAHEIESGYSNPAEVLMKFAALEEWREANATATLKNLGNSLNLAVVFSESLRNDPAISGDAVRTWVTTKEIKKLLGNRAALHIYLGIIYKQIEVKDVRFIVAGDSVITMAQIMEDNKDNLVLFENKIDELSELAIKADNIKKDFERRKAGNIPFTNDDYYSYINTSFDVIEYGFSIATVFNKKLDIASYTRIARKCNDLYRHIYKEEYAQALINGVDIFGAVNELKKQRAGDILRQINATAAGRQLKLDKFEDIGKNKIGMVRALADRTTDAALKNQLSRLVIYYEARDWGEFIGKVRKYGLFMASVVSAKTPEEVKTVLENAILPVGSSSIKKNSALNISIQSYLGAYAAQRKEDNLNIAWNDPVGVVAPIGISFSAGFKKAGSLSLLVSLLDLGAIVDYRLKKDTVSTGSGTESGVVEKDYKVELGQIFSPGLHIVYGFPWNIPLSLGLGGQYGPGLSKIQDGSAVVNNPFWRWNAFLAVDIPFFNLYSKPHRK